MRRRSSRCRKTAATISSGRSEDHDPGRDADVDLGRRGDDRHQQDRRRIRALQLERRVQIAGFDINDVGFLRRADTRNIGTGSSSAATSESVVSQPHDISTSTPAGTRRGRLYSGGNINAHAVFTNNWSTVAGTNVNGLNFDDRATRGGPGVYMEGGGASGTTSTPTIDGSCRWSTSAAGFVETRVHFARFNPEFTIRRSRR